MRCRFPKSGEAGAQPAVVALVEKLRAGREEAASLWVGVVAGEASDEVVRDSVMAVYKSSAQ